MNLNREPLAADPRQMNAALRTQLGEIAAAGQLLMGGAGERERRYLALINRAAFRCDQILYEEELARRLDDEDGLQVRWGSLDLAEWCRGASARAAELLDQGGITLTCSCKEEPLLTLADRELLDELLYALVSNAARAAGPEGRVWVTLSRRGENAVLTVADEGEGFSDRSLERLLGDEPLEPDLTPGAGAGLGLRLCRAIVELHGGLLMLETGPGAGTRCAASLPLREGRRDRLNDPSAESGFDRAYSALAGVLPPESFLRHD